MGKRAMAGLTDADKLMFADFMDWVNGLRHDKGNACFRFNDQAFQSFLRDEGISLRQCSKPISKSVRGKNVIKYNCRKSAVGDLARHIRNAFAHSRIIKSGGFFVMHDAYKAKGQGVETLTMRGRVAVGVMPGLLAAIQANRQLRGRQAVQGDPA